MIAPVLLLVAVSLISLAASSQEAYRPPADDSAARAAAFLRSLISKSPSHDGAPLREFAIRDVDHDGKFEVTESISEVEETTTGFLAGANALPCVWVNIYREKGGRFQLATGEFTSFLLQRRILYEHWLSYLRATGTDPQGTRACADAGLARVAGLLASRP